MKESVTKQPDSLEVDDERNKSWDPSFRSVSARTADRCFDELAIWKDLATCLIREVLITA